MKQLEIDYQRELAKKQKTIKDLNLIREQTRKLRETQKFMQRSKQQAMKESYKKMQQAIRNKNKKQVAAYAKDFAKSERELKAVKRMANISNAVNSLAKTNKQIQKQINQKVEQMALRNARATNFISKAISKTRNAVDGVKLAKLKTKGAWERYKLLDSMSMYNKIAAKGVNKKSSIMTPEYGKSKIVNPEYLKKYSMQQKGSTSIYTNPKNKVEVRVSGNFVSADGGILKDRVKAILDVAKAKNWDLQKLKVNGSPAFKKEVQKQIQKQQLENKARKYEMEQAKKTIEHQQQAKKESQLPKTVDGSLFGKVEDMKASGNDTMKQIQQNKNRQSGKAR